MFYRPICAMGINWLKKCNQKCSFSLFKRIYTGSNVLLRKILQALTKILCLYCRYNCLNNGHGSHSELTRRDPGLFILFYDNVFDFDLIGASRGFVFFLSQPMVLSADKGLDFLNRHNITQLK